VFGIFFKKQEQKQEKCLNKCLNAYNRLICLAKTMLDINPNIADIKLEKIYDNGYNKYHIYSIETNLGKRFLTIKTHDFTMNGEKNIDYIGFSEAIHISLELYGFACLVDNTKYIYKIIFSNMEKTIDIKPSLVRGSNITEEQIFNSIIEIEDIINKEKYKTKSEEHNSNLNNFINRFTVEQIKNGEFK
jgi:hypothetical protein